tara:strand:+ start:325 stop:462 length:138 start_codon:yes stop_codon:yes gene_type:complete
MELVVLVVVLMEVQDPLRVEQDRQPQLIQVVVEVEHLDIIVDQHL